jgi:hypothetical protein
MTSKANRPRKLRSLTGKDPVTKKVRKVRPGTKFSERIIFIE